MHKINNQPTSKLRGIREKKYQYERLFWVGVLFLLITGKVLFAAAREEEDQKSTLNLLNSVPENDFLTNAVVFNRDPNINDAIAMALFDDVFVWNSVENYFERNDSEEDRAPMTPEELNELFMYPVNSLPPASPPQTEEYDREVQEKGEKNFLKIRTIMRRVLCDGIEDRNTLFGIYIFCRCFIVTISHAQAALNYSFISLLGEEGEESFGIHKYILYKFLIGYIKDNNVPIEDMEKVGLCREIASVLKRFPRSILRNTPQMEQYRSHLINMKVDDSRFYLNMLPEYLVTMSSDNKNANLLVEKAIFFIQQVEKHINTEEEYLNPIAMTPMIQTAKMVEIIKIYKALKEVRDIICNLHPSIVDNKE